MTTALRTRRRSLRATLLAAVHAAVDRLTAAWNLLAAAQKRLLADLAKARPGRSAPARTRTAVAAFHRALAAFHRAVASFAERWAATDLPIAYRDGGLDALRHIGRDP
ncbi:MAG TPA: hypothetical protein VFY14_20960, partial [Streptomyces sp.]|nr:hypothetical protein [Streptomyces sp.]